MLFFLLPSQKMFCEMKLREEEIESKTNLILISVRALSKSSHFILNVTFWHLITTSNPRGQQQSQKPADFLITEAFGKWHITRYTVFSGTMYILYCLVTTNFICIVFKSETIWKRQQQKFNLQCASFPDLRSS